MNVTAGLRRRTIVTALVAAAATVVTATPAHASDWGGDGWPTDPACSNVTTVKTTPSPTMGKQIGEPQLRWSWGCYRNWSRVLLWGNMYTSAPAGTVSEVEHMAADLRSHGSGREGEDCFGALLGR
ncbi:hypothetical protein [Kribbella sp. NPDC023855]|uniref:hypothetical protein n=1 Tax=Kribbella sp. NPDC023855 TaxID=3154698 RepID=UPI0033EC50B7